MYSIHIGTLGTMSKNILI